MLEHVWGAQLMGATGIGMGGEAKIISNMNFPCQKT